MLDKVKNFFAAMTSAAILLYVTGFLTQQAHDRMLGILMVEPLSLDYLITGGEFFLATLFAIFSTLFSRFYYFLAFFLLAVIILRPGFNCKERKNQQIQPSRSFLTIAVIIILVYCFLLIPLFTSTFVFHDLLLLGHNNSPAPLHKYLPDITKDTWAWILNSHANPASEEHLNDFYVLSLLAAALSGALLFSLYKYRKADQDANRDIGTDTNTATETGTGTIDSSQDTGEVKNSETTKAKVTNETTATIDESRVGEETKGEETQQVTGSLFKRAYHKCKTLDRSPRQKVLAFSFFLLLFLFLVQVIVIPMNYGILLKSNIRPEVRLDVEGGASGFTMLENLEPQGEHNMWFLRENDNEMLLYAVYFEKGGDYPVFRLINVKKALVRKIDILGHSSIFKIK